MFQFGRFTPAERKEAWYYRCWKWMEKKCVAIDGAAPETSLWFYEINWRLETQDGEMEADILDSLEQLG